MEEQEAMFRSGEVSLALSLALAAATLVAVTGNLLLAALASAAVAGVVAIFLASMQILGWSLGACGPLSVTLRHTSSACATRDR